MKGIKKILTFAVVLMMFMTIAPSQITATEEKENTEPVYVISGSDFQHPYGGEVNAEIVEKILLAMKNDGVTSPYGFLFAGDYGWTETTAVPLQDVVSKVFPELSHKVYIEGNHDDLAETPTKEDEPLASTGANDPQTELYGVFVVNESDFPTRYRTGEAYKGVAVSEEDVKKISEETAAKLESYFEQKIAENYTKPIFVIGHLPLHANERTFQGMNSEAAPNYSFALQPETCGLYANALVDVMNEAGEKGLNIIYLYGHNHAWGFDSVVGGDCVYLAKGEALRYANGGTPKEPNVESSEIQFTYMNSGYVGYYQYDTCNKLPSANDGALTMTVFKITEDTVEVLRYDENGRYILARQPYNSPVPEDDALLGYTNLLTLEEAGGTIEDVTNVKAKIGTDGAVITLNKEIQKPLSITGYLVGAIAGLVIVVVPYVLWKKKKSKQERV